MRMNTRLINLSLSVPVALKSPRSIKYPSQDSIPPPSGAGCEKFPITYLCQSKHRDYRNNTQSVGDSESYDDLVDECHLRKHKE